MPLDGLSRFQRKNKEVGDKIYRANSRINFLYNRPKNDAIAPESDKISINNAPLNPPVALERPPRPKTSIIKLVLVITLILLTSAAMYLSEIVFAPNSGSLSGLNKFNPLKQLARLITSPDKRLDGELSDRINILAMGIGGPGHDGPYLTDTIIIISLKPSTGEIGLISIPRDLVIKENGQWVKINQVYATAVAEQIAEPGDYTSKIIGETFGLTIHYYGVLNFNGFEDFIDNIGGIAVDIPVGFTDNLYPTDDFKTTTVSFSPGLTDLDGQTALIYARSRHGSNFEGSDFARSRRQQLILQAVKDKVLKFSTLLSPQKLSSILDLINNDVETNLSIWQIIKIVNLTKNSTEEDIRRFVLDDSPESLLEPGFTEAGAWILKPKDGNFASIQRLVNNLFNIGAIKEEAAKIEIQNGTAVPGLAYWTTVYLERLGYNIIKYGNGQTQDYQQSVIYDLTSGEKKKTLKWLKEELSAYVSKTLPESLIKMYPSLNATSTSTEEHPDFIGILGTNYAETFKLPAEKTATTTPTSTASTLSTTTPAVPE